MTAFLLTATLLPQPTSAQTPAIPTPLPAPQGRFLQATTQVGQPLDYELRYEHAPDLEVVFPDSLAGFAPFEFVGKTWFATRTRSGRSLDRAIYHLRTFALDSVQTLTLPVLVLRGADTLRVAPAPARVRLRRVTPAAGPSFGPTAGPPALRQSLALEPIAPAFDYPLWLALAASAVAAGAGGLALFRRPIRRRYQAYKRRKNHQYFLAQFARHVERFSLSQSATNVERAVSLWKNYLSGLDASALTSFTSREIVTYFREDADVKEALETTDRVVYGNLEIEDEAALARAFGQLRSFAERRYAALAAG
ncbi:hypothetical protein [uncultured Hymenobacter sp.]|uniref:hypothetical protein n=1 Tax=uncultured Hymenobacter sp. TaxID=170016 RepID=UPI0035C9E64A